MARTLRGTVLRRSDRTVMVLAAVFAALAALLVFVVLSNAKSDDKTPISTSAGTATVITAAGAVPAGTRLSGDMLKLTPVPNELVLEGAYTAVEPLVGLTARSDLIKGEQVTASKIGEAQTGDKSLALLVPRGLRAVAIPAEEKSIVGGMILPGDVVDVIAIFSSAEVGEDKAVTLLQKVQILAIGQKAQERVPPPAGGVATPAALGRTPDDASPQPSAHSVTLAVTPDQAQLLALVADKAKLVLTLRPRGEDTNVQLGESSLRGLGIVP